MITGKTQLVAIVGTPIQQVKSPENFNAHFAEKGTDIAMIAMDVRASEIDACVELIRGWNNLRGCVVTVPYKQQFASRVDSLTVRAAALGVVNVVRRYPDGRLTGDMVDGFGFVEAARTHGFEVSGCCALVVGAGGVGSAIAYALCEEGARSIALIESDPERLSGLATTLGRSFPDIEIVQGCYDLSAFDLVVNATPVGMGADGALPLDLPMLETLAASTFVADVVTLPAMTPFLAFARERGCKVQTGPEMARAQLSYLGAAMGVMPPLDSRQA